MALCLFIHALVLRFRSTSLPNICSNDTTTGVSRQALGGCISLSSPPLKERRFIPGMNDQGFPARLSVMSNALSAIFTGNVDFFD
jgi:hypothetical protein